jgi:hypothetical protein
MRSPAGERGMSLQRLKFGDGHAIQVERGLLEVGVGSIG